MKENEPFPCGPLICDDLLPSLDQPTIWELMQATETVEGRPVVRMSTKKRATPQ